MTENSDKQLFQLQNIVDTLLEATDHFAALIKKKEFQQSISIFSSIVEGTEVIISMLHQIDQRFTEQTSHLENNLVMIAKELEQGKMMKIAEIIQFSFRPRLVRLKQTFLDDVGDFQKTDTIVIGVFNSWRNPREFYPEARIKAMLYEAEKQDAVLYFFSSNDVDFSQKNIEADTFLHGEWKRDIIPFPDVINNVGGGRISHIERKLRREIPFTSFHVGNKYTLPERMIKYRKFTNLLVPFKVCTNQEIIVAFLKENNRAVFKALRGNRGENIYFITKKGNRYILLDQKKESILNEDNFQRFVQQTILRKKGSYIIQRYIHTRTKANEPYHFRAHVQKDGEANWQLTHIYPRIGNRKSNLSNISTEGRIEDFPNFLIEEFGETQGTTYEKEILALSLDVTKHLDSIYGFALNELGLDFAIDETGRIWMHEANNGPQTAFHEEKRAIQTIAYAKYIATNGIMYTDAHTKYARIKGQFHARTSNLSFASIDNRILVGVLISKHTNDSFITTLAKVAEKNNVTIYSFTPKDIDYDYHLVKGFFYQNEEWKPQVTEYPDVIIDRTNWRGSPQSQMLYDELEDIPFTNEWPVQSSKRSAIYTSVQTDVEIKGQLADFQIVQRPRHVFQYIEKYGKVRLKRNSTSFIHSNIVVERQDNNYYLVTEPNKNRTYNEVSLRHYVQDLLDKYTYIVQNDVRRNMTNQNLYDIYVHVMKDDQNQWDIVSQHVSLDTTINNKDSERSDETVPSFIHNQYGGEHIELVTQQLDNLCIKAASFLEKESDIAISEVAFILTIDQYKKISIVDINPSGPEAVYDKFSHAESIISYATYLATNGMAGING